MYGVHVGELGVATRSRSRTDSPYYSVVGQLSSFPCLSNIDVGGTLGPHQENAHRWSAVGALLEPHELCPGLGDIIGRPPCINKEMKEE